MNELYEIIEAKIKASGYPRKISGAEVYDDICDQIDGKENGEYLLLSHFDLGVLTMKTPEGVFEVDFDAE